MWVPVAVRYGVPFDEFYRLNPARLERYIPYFIEQEAQSVSNNHLGGWIYGQYVAASVGSCLSKKVKYPKEPYYMNTHFVEEETQKITDADRFEAFALSFNAGRKDLPDFEEAKIVVDIPADVVDLTTPPTQ